MLQPLQLQEVSNRYAGEILELREFLAKAGCAVGTGRALGQIAGRLHEDRTFRRDLTSHVWVLLDRYGRISTSDLLGVLAVAAVGQGLAAAADEDDAHRLLRFVMEARHSLDALSGEDGVAAPAAADAMAGRSAEPLRVARGEAGRDDSAEARGRAGVEPSQHVERDLFSEEETPDNEIRRRRLPWVVGAACALAILLAVLWTRHEAMERAGTPAAPVARNIGGDLEPPAAIKEAAPSAPSAASAPSASRSDGREAGAVHSEIGRSKPRAMTLSAAARGSQGAPAVVHSIARPEPSASPAMAAGATHGPVLAATAPAASPQNTLAVATPAPPTAPAPVTRITGIGFGATPAMHSPKTNPAQAGATVATNNGPSSPPAVPQSSQQGSDNSAKMYRTPTLLRRHPSAPDSAFTDGAEVAAATPPAVGGGANASAGTAHSGTVRATSLGTMAANLMYSPLPVYPAAASASHVQGEVKLSADVDRQGNVASVRVISGPPELRDAAVDAVQRWRYRPFVTANGPKPMAAIAIMDFELP